MSLLRTAALAAVLVLPAWVVPVPAQAAPPNLPARVFIEGTGADQVLVYAAGTSQQNRVTIATPDTVNPELLEIHDVVPITVATPNCVHLPGSDTSVACRIGRFGSATYPDTVALWLGDLDDVFAAPNLRHPFTVDIHGGPANDRLTAGPHSDTSHAINAHQLYGDDGRDVLNGGTGNAWLIGGAGSDELRGGDGARDIVRYDTTARVEANLDGLANDGTASESDLIAADVEGITGGDGNDLLVGSLGADILAGGAGNDVIDARAGDDVIDGDFGHDTVDGGPGNDYILGDAGNDLLVGDVGNDQLDGGDGDDTVGGNEGDDRVQGGIGTDQLYGDEGADVLANRGGTDTLRGGDGDDSLNGGWTADTIYGDAGDDQIFASDGDDLVHGGPGDDWVSGYHGNDTIHGDEGKDYLMGDWESDTLTGGAGDDTLNGGDGELILFNILDGGPHDARGDVCLHGLARNCES